MQQCSSAALAWIANLSCSWQGQMDGVNKAGLGEAVASICFVTSVWFVLSVLTSVYAATDRERL